MPETNQTSTINPTLVTKIGCCRRKPMALVGTTTHKKKITSSQAAAAQPRPALFRHRSDGPCRHRSC